MEGSGRHAVLEGPNGQEGIESYEQQEQREQEPLKAEVLFGVLKAFDHIRDFKDAQIEEMYARIYEDAEQYYSEVDPQYLLRIDKEMKEIQLDYIDNLRSFLQTVYKKHGEQAGLPEPKKDLEGKPTREEKIAYYQEDLETYRDVIEEDPSLTPPEVPSEVFSLDDQINFVASTAGANKRANFREITQDRFNRLRSHVPEDESGQPDPEALRALDELEEQITPQIVLLAKLKVEQKRRDKRKLEELAKDPKTRTEEAREKYLDPDSKLDRTILDNIDAVGLVFLMKSIPNVAGPKDIMKAGYTPREAIFTYEFAQYAKKLIDPEDTGQINFPSEEEMKEISEKLEKRVKDFFPTDPRVKIQKQAMLRRLMKYLAHEDALLEGKGPESIGLDPAEAGVTVQDTIERTVNLISEDLKRDTDLEPDETYKATRAFREEDLRSFLQSALELRESADQEEKRKHLGDIVKMLTENYDLFSRLEKNELGLPELYDANLRDAAAEQSSDRIVKFLNMFVGFEDEGGEYQRRLEEYARILIELDHNASLRNSIFQEGAGLSNEIFDKLEAQEAQLEKEFRSDFAEWQKRKSEQQEADREIADAIQSIHYESGRLKQIKQEMPRGNELYEVRKTMETGVQDLSIQSAQDRLDKTEKDRKELLLLKLEAEERLGIT